MKIFKYTFTILSGLFITYVILSFNVESLRYEGIGIWASLMTMPDKIMASITAGLVMLLSYMIDCIVFPMCYECGKVRPRYEMTLFNVSGSGPDTGESGYFCKDCC